MSTKIMFALVAALPAVALAQSATASPGEAFSIPAAAALLTPPGMMAVMYLLLRQERAARAERDTKFDAVTETHAKRHDEIMAMQAKRHDEGMAKMGDIATRCAVAIEQGAAAQRELKEIVMDRVMSARPRSEA